MEGVPGLRRLHHLVVWQRAAIARSDHDDELMPKQVLHNDAKDTAKHANTQAAHTDWNHGVHLKPGSPLPTQPARWPSNAFVTRDHGTRRGAGVSSPSAAPQPEMELTGRRRGAVQGCSKAARSSRRTPDGQIAAAEPAQSFRAGSKGLSSGAAWRSSTSGASRLAVAGASVTPSIPCPVAR